MGYARIFWIREQPIRQYIAASGRDDTATEEVGKQVLSLAAEDSFRAQGEANSV